MHRSPVLAVPLLLLALSADAAAAARTLVVALEVQADAARVLSFTLKAREPIDRAPTPAPRAHDADGPTQLELALLGPGGARLVRRLDVAGLCLQHPAGAPPHLEGDRIRLHQESIVAELPELAGFDRLEVAVHDRAGEGLRRRVLGAPALDPAAFVAAGGPFSAADLPWAGSAADDPVLPAASTASWPENWGESVNYVVFGDETEADRRINIVIVPDGYRHDEKALMETHAADLVQHFRQKTPYAEHDPFLNYVLVYAYSVASGTDQCDCSIVLDSAMGTRFPLQNPQCGHSDNRCLYYGGGCDTPGTANITAAELRAPYHDTTIVMVNTSRYGGCGGARAVYSAANASAREIAVHELGHSLGGLADEYTAYTGCGSSAGEINTSKNATQGAWPEWIAALGAPRQGAQYYSQCLYRPADNCEMRSLNQPFCAVCNQRWSLVVFGHPRVAPSAPLSSAAPASPVGAWSAVPVDFDVVTRLATGAAVTNRITWTLSGPGVPPDTVLASGPAPHLTHAFPAPGTYALTAQVVADTNFVKPSKYGANVDTANWTVEVAALPPAPEVSPPGAAAPLAFADPSTVVWQDAGAAGVLAYNLYRGSLAGLPTGSYGACLFGALPAAQATLGPEVPAAGAGWTYLVSGENPLSEGSLGQSSAGLPRLPDAPCP